jgi:hypothetical protein
MKSIQLTLLLVCLACSISIAQSLVSQVEKNEMREIDHFSAIDASDGIYVIATQGDSVKVTVEASSEDLRNKIKTEVIEGVLRVRFYYQDDPNWKGLVNSKEVLKVFVTYHKMDSVKLSNGAHLQFINPLVSDSLKVSLASGSSLEGELKVVNLTADLRGGANTTLKGTAKYIDVLNREGSSFYGYKLISDDVHALAISGSTINLHIKNELIATSRNHSVIRYKGKGKIKESTSSEKSKIKKVI